MISLKDLDLSHNKLTTIRSHCFKIKEAKLKSLDLKYNQIKKYEPNSFCYLMGYDVDSPGPCDRPISFGPEPNDIGCIREVLTFGNEQVSVHHSDDYRKRTCF